jgi:predicted nucleic acid-binding protein
VIFVLDTNVLSERTKKHPNRNVEDFLRRLPVENARVSAMVLAEIAQGVENNPTPALRRFLNDILGVPVAPFGETEALEWGRITSAGIAAGLEMMVRDTVIAATAVAHGWTVATRNTKDFAPLGVKVFNPWTERL